MNTPLGRGLIILGIMFFMLIIAYFTAPIEPLPRYDTAAEDRPPIMVEEWADRVFSTQMALNSSNYEQRLQAIEPFFTKNAYRDYIIFLQRTGVIHNLQNNTVEYRLEYERRPEWTTHGLKDGVYTWILEGELQFNSYFGSNVVSTPVDLFISVSRSGDPDAVEGLKVSALTLKSEVPVSN